MKKFIKPNEPIIGFAAFGKVEEKNPHFVGKITSWNPGSREIEIAESGNGNEILSGTLDKPLELREGQHVLLQFKEAGVHSLLKVKDVAQTRFWETGSEYTPNLVECVKFTNYSFFPINRKKRKKKHNKQEEVAVA